jgi:hypothetical protein
MVTDVSTDREDTMRSAIVAAQMLADSALRSAALTAVAEILEHLTRWDTPDPAALGDADADVCRAWALNAGILTAAAGAGWSGPVADAVAELRAAARAADEAADGVNPLLPELPA